MLLRHIYRRGDGDCGAVQFEGGDSNRIRGNGSGTISLLIGRIHPPGETTQSRLTCQRKHSSPSAFPFLQHRILNTIGGFDVFLCAPDVSHNVGPVRALGEGHWFNASNGPAVAGNKQRFPLLKLVQDSFGLLMQLFCGDNAHGVKSNTLKVSPQAQG
jgi:hypothetical protein